MAITDINISEQLETSAPSIKYEGNEGPKSPEEQRVAQLKEEYMQYVFEQKDLDEPIMSFEEWYQAVYQASQMGVQAPQEEITAEEVMTRAPAAYGGIMDRASGRRAYGLGSIKKRLRKLIPNEVAQVASVAAPFVAPFNPLIGGAMAGLGGFDQHGSLSRGLKSGLMTYGGGQLARGIGGAGPQWGLKGAGTGSGLGSYFTSPTSGAQLWGASKGSNIAGGLASKPTVLGDTGGSMDYMSGSLPAGEAAQKAADKTLTSGLLKKIDKFAVPIMLGAMGIAGAMTKPQDVQEAMKASRGTGLDIDSIREEVQIALADPTGEKWEVLQAKYPYMGEQTTKKAAEGGRIGLYAGGQSIPSDYTMEDARKTSMQDKMGGITDVMKQADLYRQGDVGQFYAAQGGRIRAQEGGLMDLGGMEKDYRNDGGFVPIGGKEKADDVPARLSKNEFVFTADAVRGAGGGDIDKGAEIMENVMKNLEQGGQISEETQGLTGAREMFDVSERLSEVV